VELWRFQVARADFRAAEELVVQLLATAEGQDDPIVASRARGAGVDKFYLGEFARAREHLARAIAAMDRAQTGAPDPLRQDSALRRGGFLAGPTPWPAISTAPVRRAETALQLARRSPSLQPGARVAPRLRDPEFRQTPTAVRTSATSWSALAASMGSRSSGDRADAHRIGDEPRRDLSGGVAVTQEGADAVPAVGQRVGLAHALAWPKGAGDRRRRGRPGRDRDALGATAAPEEHAFCPLRLWRGEALAHSGETAAAAQVFQRGH